MTPKQIKSKQEKIHKKIEHWAEQLIMLQEKCEHPNVTKTYDANTGNYDPSQDSYWVVHECPDCTKRWTIYT